QTTCADALTGAGNDIVAGVHVDHEPTFGLAEDLNWNATAACCSVSVSRHLGRYETPDESTLVDILLSEARLIGMHVQGKSHHAKRCVVQWAQFFCCSIEKRCHRAARNGDADAVIRCLHSVEGDRVTTLGCDQVSDKASIVSSLLSDPTWCGRCRHVAVLTDDGLSLVNALPEVRLHVLINYRGALRDMLEVYRVTVLALVHGLLGDFCL